MSRLEPPPDLHFVEPLSEREREILALLAENRSNQEIANLLHLALSTVKWYLRQMFGKLGVNDRRTAVERGRILGLLKEEHSHSTPSHLPTPATPFVGREAETKALVHLLSEPIPRLITLLGPGGSGKTRLAVQVASTMAGQGHSRFQDGIWFVPLELLQDPESIPQAIASVVGFIFYDREREPRQQLLDYFRQRRVLLILDNFEHLISPKSVHLVFEMLTHAPGVKVLATSRSRLNLQEEQLYPVAGMETPPISHISSADLAGYGALELFLQCARRVQPEFAPDEENLLAMVRICQAVQGLPLGIELAAAWMEMLSPYEILSEIERSLDFLKAEWVDASERHHSLRSVFDASWKLLNRAEQAVVMALSVFQGSFSREAAQPVSGTTPETLRALVHKSWLTHQTDGRFHFHPLLRQYAGEKLRADRQAWEDARTAHARYFAELFQKLGRQMQGAQQVEAFEHAVLEFENVRAAWHWLVEQGQTGVLVEQVLLALVLFCTARWRGKELFALIRKAQGKPMDQQRNTKAAIHQAILMAAELLFDGYGELAVRLLKLESSTSLSRFLPEARVKHTWNALSDEPPSDLDGYWWVMTAVLYIPSAGTNCGFCERPAYPLV